ncbi:MAG TPA: DUF4389 domain-containing protein [Gemmatimonadaceae bacterium]|nr:DUF4389 domain-containing protein [Gemmatimonadaceae bacterium]
METHALRLASSALHPVRIRFVPALDGRERLTTAFRFLLALPHLVLVGGPIAAVLTWNRGAEDGLTYGWGAGGGVLGVVAAVIAVIAWFAILFTGRFPKGLWDLAAYYLRWRVRVMAYAALLRDEYPPFGDGMYPVELELPRPDEPRDRLTVAFRPLLAIPHLVAIWVLGLAWALATILASFSNLFAGRYPVQLYRFAVGVMRWTTRVEAYVLLLRDEYPPFTLTG